jgi:hypothetical protein
MRKRWNGRGSVYRHAMEPEHARCHPAQSWPLYYPPKLVRDLVGTDIVTGEAASIERGYVLHRIELEKVRVLDACRSLRPRPRALRAARGEHGCAIWLLG